MNLSASTYEIIKDFFECEYRGLVKAKSKGEVAMYFANGLRPELAVRRDGRTPNNNFLQRYQRLKAGVKDT